MFKKIFLLPALALSFSFVLSAQAQDRTVRARSNDSVSEYILDNGNLYAVFQSGGQKCQITSGVSQVKTSQHPSDRAMIYFLQRGDLMYMNRVQATGRNCPSMKTHVYEALKDVKEFKLVSTTETNVVLLAVSRSGTLQAQTDAKLFNLGRGYTDIVMGCMGESGKSFNTFVGFALRNDGSVLKVKGQNPDASKTDDNNGRGFSSLSDFKQVRNVCK